MKVSSATDPARAEAKANWLGRMHTLLPAAPESLPAPTPIASSSEDLKTSAAVRQALDCLGTQMNKESTMIASRKQEMPVAGPSSVSRSSTFAQRKASSSPHSRQIHHRTGAQLESSSCPRCPVLLAPETPLQRMPKGVMSLSLGKHANHTLQRKIEVCSRAGYQGIEIHWEDLVTWAKTLDSTDEAPSRTALLSAAKQIRQMCVAHKLDIICLEPFLHYPGVLPISKRDQRLHEEVPLWFEVSDLLGTDVIQVASAMFGGEGVATGDEARVVEDLRLLAEAGLNWRGGDGASTSAPRPKYWAYEAMCFGAYTTSWEQAWHQVQLVDRPNFGMVVDTFQILGACYADPSDPSGNGKARDADAALEATIDTLRSTFGGDSPEAKRNRDKVFFVQLGDAELIRDPPLSETHPLFDKKQHANLKMAWARQCRLFQGEGYLPCHRVAQVFLEECGWRGWLSAEYFNRDQMDEDPAYVDRAAQRCMVGHQACLDHIKSAEAKQEVEGAAEA